MIQNREFFSLYIIKLFLFIKGKIHEDYLREILTTFGERFTDDQVDDMYKEAPIK